MYGKSAFSKTSEHHCQATQELTSNRTSISGHSAAPKLSSGSTAINANTVKRGKDHLRSTTYGNSKTLQKEKPSGNSSWQPNTEKLWYSVGLAISNCMQAHS